MKAIRVHETGGPEVLHLEEVPTPDPGAGQARVRIEAAGLNFIDVYQREGRYPMDLPMTPGVEAAGVVDAVGPDVEGLAEGDRVAYAMQVGAYAEQAVVPAAQLVRVPDDVDLRVAAAVMVQGMTAHYLTHSTVRLEQGMTALVHAASGGVGHLLVQVAKRLGARVLATTSTDEKERLARKAGADEVIRYRDVDFKDEVERLTDGAGLDVVYDSVGKDTFDRGLDCLRPRGWMVLYGASSGAVPPMDPQVLQWKGSLYLTRPTLGHYIANPDELAWRTGDVFGWIRAGELEVRIDRTWPLAEVADAHRYIEAGKTVGKVLLLP
ncbi:MAG: quinone oxidoreductase family protein [Egibacteraceae bacterium]